MRRRDVLIAGAVGTGALLVDPLRTLAGQPAGLDHTVRQLMSAGRLPGLSAAVVREGEVIWSRAWGLANIAAGRRVTPDTLGTTAIRTIPTGRCGRRPRSSHATSRW